VLAHRLLDAPSTDLVKEEPKRPPFAAPLAWLRRAVGDKPEGRK
jgi:hypothetical protein